MLKCVCNVVSNYRQNLQKSWHSWHGSIFTKNVSGGFFPAEGQCVLPTWFLWWEHFYGIGFIISDICLAVKLPYDETLVDLLQSVSSTGVMRFTSWSCFCLLSSIISSLALLRNEQESCYQDAPWISEDPYLDLCTGFDMQETMQPIIFYNKLCNSL